LQPPEAEQIVAYTFVSATICSSFFEAAAHQDGKRLNKTTGKGIFNRGGLRRAMTLPRAWSISLTSEINIRKEANSR
jgi:hypothetical protein